MTQIQTDAATIRRFVFAAFASPSDSSGVKVVARMSGAISGNQTSTAPGCRCAHPGYELICLARKRNFMPQPATNWHDGQISQNLSSPSRKNIPLSFSRKSPA
jgi:hypothetical protein